MFCCYFYFHNPFCDELTNIMNPIFSIGKNTSIPIHAAVVTGNPAIFPPIEFIIANVISNNNGEAINNAVYTYEYVDSASTCFFLSNL